MSWPALPGRDEQLAIDQSELVDPVAIRLVVKTTTGDPSSPGEGDIYVNTADNKVRVYADGAWRDLATWT